MCMQLCCFFIPATGVIPLHNHPGMTVFSKLLLGKMHIKSYDLVDPIKNSDASQGEPLNFLYLCVHVSVDYEDGISTINIIVTWIYR